MDRKGNCTLNLEGASHSGCPLAEDGVQKRTPSWDIKVLGNFRTRQDGVR